MPDASWGYTAEQGLRGVLGGENLDKINKGEGAMSPEGMRQYIMEAPDKKDVSYSDESRRFAKAVLIVADRNPSDFLDKSSEPFKYDFAKDVDEDYDLTGFMYGWAINAIRYILNAKPTGNPAIIDIG